MTAPIWLGGCVATLFCVVLALRLERWWPLPFVLSCFFGMATGVLIWSWPEWLRNAWWLVGLVYAVALPIWKAVERVRIRAAERAALSPDALRDGASVTADEENVYIHNSTGRIIGSFAHGGKPRN